MKNLLIGIAVGLYLLSGLAILFTVYLLWRNEKVCEFRVSLIESSRHDLLERLPSYNTMVYRFWVWPLSRFLERKA